MALRAIRTTGGIGAQGASGSGGGSSPVQLSFAGAAGTVGVPYSQTVVASGGTGPYLFAITAGALASGLTLHATTGVIDGTPTTAGTSSFTVRVTDSVSVTASISPTIVVNAVAPLALQFGSWNLYKGVVSPTLPLVATGGMTPYTYTQISGSLPAGLTFNSGPGTVTGTPTQAGIFNLTFRVTDNRGVTADASAVLTVADTVTQLALSPVNAQVGIPYVGKLYVTGGTGPYAYILLLGSLPAWASFNTATGTITGTPTAAGFTGPLQFVVTDANGSSINSGNTYLNVMDTTGASAVLAVQTVTARDLGHGTDLKDSVTSQVTFRVGVAILFTGGGGAGAGLPAQNATYFVSKDGGSHWYWRNSSTWALQGQEIGFVEPRPAAPATWYVAALAGKIQGDPTVSIATGLLPGGTVLSAGFAVLGVAGNLPGSTDITTLAVAAPNATQGPHGPVWNTSFPYNTVDDASGIQYWKIPSLSLNYSGCLADPNCARIQVTAQDFDANNNPIGPEKLWTARGIGAPNANATFDNLDLGGIAGPYGTDNGQRTGSLCKVGFRVYCISQLDISETAFQNAQAFTLQSAIGSSGLQYVVVAAGGQTPAGYIDLGNVNPQSLSGHTQIDPNTNTVTVPNTNYGQSLLPDPSFEYATPGYLWGLGLSPIGNAPQWTALVTDPVNDKIQIVSGGGSSGANYCRLTGPGAGVRSAVASVQPGQPVYVQVQVRAGGSGGLTVTVFWSDQSGVSIGSSSVGVATGTFGAWALGPSNTLTAPANAAQFQIGLQNTSAVALGQYWEVDDVYLQPVINQTVGSTTALTDRASVGGTPTILRAVAPSSNTYVKPGVFFTSVPSGNQILMTCVDTTVGTMEIMSAGGYGGSINYTTAFSYFQISRPSADYAGTDFTFRDQAGVLHTVKGGILIS